jgi:hypothetical protein
MSSRKMSLSGWRPAVTVSLSSRKRLPALGPRRTTSMAVFSRSSSTGATTSSSTSASRSWAARLIVVVESSGVVTSAAPQFAQKWAPSGFL